MIWLIGNKGMLGSEVEELLKENNFSYVSSDQETDITDYLVLKRFVKNKKIEWIINCAAYTAVDKAEKEIEKAYGINRDGVKNIAKIASENKSKLIHISTDYVFDGKKDKQYAYSEEDIPNPMGIYGKSKLAGEDEIKKLLNNYFIIRTAWLYGVNGSNFVYTMLRLFKENNLVKVVSDQWGTPTYTGDLAEAIIRIAKSNSDQFGIYHFTNEGTTTWYGFAKEIYIQAKKFGLTDAEKETKIVPIMTEEYPTAAVRPKNSILSKEKIKQTFNLEIRSWIGALKDFLYSLSLRTK